MKSRTESSWINRILPDLRWEHAREIIYQHTARQAAIMPSPSNTPSGEYPAVRWDESVDEYPVVICE